MDYSAALAYVDGYWPRITRFAPRQRGTLIALPRPYLVPSDGSMFQEMYYWDSYFMALGVRGTPHEGLIVDMVENMAYLFRQFGVIPNASRFYFLSRSQPPFFTRMLWLAFAVKEARGDRDLTTWLRRMMRLAELEHVTVWLGTAQPHFRQVYRGLSRYFDINFLNLLASCESGWDHSTRCDDRWLDHLPVDLNSVLYQHARDLAHAAELMDQPRRAKLWRLRADQRAATMQELMWDEEQGFFFDFDWVNATRSQEPSLAGFFPLWSGLARTEQAARIVREWLPRFEFPCGLVTTLRQQEERQWAYPNGWAPLQWIVTEGLIRYGFQEEAYRIRRAWCDHVATSFGRTGTMWEKYNVVDPGAEAEAGMYGHITGFGWTNGVFKHFVGSLPAEAGTS